MNKEFNKTKLIINGKTVLVDSNQTILQACEKIGLYIPRFCYNEALSIAGNCRMCLVEIEKSPKLMPACAIKIANDMKIYTKTNLVKKTRESILEFLLINHPLDCPICDQGGECDLQDQAMVYGSDRGRFYEYKRSVQDKNAGPLIKTIMTRCIHCTRCIRYATEIAGVEVYGTTGRGKNMEVGTYISNLFNSEISGNVIDLCPVGALTSKPYAFTVRPWELKSIESIDLFDAMGSNIRIDIRGTELMRILPKANNKINQQWISDKSRFAHDGLKCQRLYYPLLAQAALADKPASSSLKQTNSILNSKVLTHAAKSASTAVLFEGTSVERANTFLTISWQKALDIIVNKMTLTHPNKQGGIIGNFVDQETIITFKKLLNQLGINNFYVEQTNSLIQNQTKINFDLRSNFLSNFDKLEDKNYDTLFLIGTNPRYEASMFNVRLRQLIIKKKNMGFDVLSLGGPLNLTYKTDPIGITLESLYLLTQGKSKNTIKVLNALNPLCVASYNIIEHINGKAVNLMLEYTLEIWKKIKDNSLNLIFQNMSQVMKHTLDNTAAEHRITDRLTPVDYTDTFNRLAMRKLHTISKKVKNMALIEVLARTKADLKTSNLPLESRAENNKDMIFQKFKVQATSAITSAVRGTDSVALPHINILHTTASLPGSLDLGFASINKKKIKDLDLIYLIGADCGSHMWPLIETHTFNTQVKEIQAPKPFIIYQGHHGCNAAKMANIILPSTTFIEKKGTYTNTEGYVQQTQLVINSEYAIYDDWKILQTLASNLNKPGLSYINNEITHLDLGTYSAGNTRSEAKVLSILNVLKKNTSANHLKKKQLQLIINSLFAQKRAVLRVQKNNEDANNQVSLRSIISLNLETYNFKKIFNNIAPFLNYSDTPSIVGHHAPKKFNNIKNQYSIFYNTPILYDRDNFYLSDIITKSSLTMGKCSTIFKNSNFI